ncbi:hypothetical protein FSC37_04240 [Piscinibacter aquaticus]|uniref:histidine kinase n=1 Tax=Piscinibacter aquaticus TaxID=392597 RepID=A0A5C6U0X1_9BURK|nr:hypothetical protein FSC37_04240 [Piscinibacter aquaticus]
MPNTPAVAPHQRKGLGLGLAIVKRPADLMGAPITLRSRAGRGTVFTLELPVGTKPRAQPSSLSSKAMAGLTLGGRLIVVVEDEPAVRSGLEVLLQGWGRSWSRSTAWPIAPPGPRRPTRPRCSPTCASSTTGWKAVATAWKPSPRCASASARGCRPSWSPAAR